MTESHVIEAEYAHLEKVHLVVDNLNTHFEKSFYETFGQEEANRILKGVAYVADRNLQKKGIEWDFTKEKAAIKFKLTQQN
jgi:hypothetical protein